MSTALYLKTSPIQAARFSFLLSVPVIAGASLLEGYRLFKYGNTLGTMPLLVGVAVSAIAGYFAIKVLLKIYGKRKVQLVFVLLFDNWNSWYSLYIRNELCTQQNLQSVLQSSLDFRSPLGVNLTQQKEKP